MQARQPSLWWLKLECEEICIELSVSVDCLDKRGRKVETVLDFYTSGQDGRLAIIEYIM